MSPTRGKVTLDRIEELETVKGHVDYRVTYTDGEVVEFNVPLELAFGKHNVSAGIPPRIRELAREYLRDKYRRDSIRRHQARETRIATRTAVTAFAILSWCEALLPKRLRDEDLGDAMEDLARFAREGRSDAQLFAKAVTTALVLIVNGIREVASALLGQKSSGS